MLRRPLKYGGWEKIVFEPSRWILDFGEDVYTCSVNLNVIMHSLLKESAWGKTYVGHPIWIPAFREHVQFFWWQFQIHLFYWLPFWNMAARGSNKLGVSVGVQVGGRVPQEPLFDKSFSFRVRVVRAAGQGSCMRAWRGDVLPQRWQFGWGHFLLRPALHFALMCLLKKLMGFNMKCFWAFEYYVFLNLSSSELPSGCVIGKNIGREPACWWYNCGF